MKNFPADLCILTPRATLTGTGDSNSLANVNTTKLPNGAQCYVIQTNEVYRLHKDIVPPVNGAVAPVAGPGAWVPESASAMFVSSVQGDPGTVDANDSTTLSLASTVPLESSDILIGMGLDPTVPAGITATAKVDTSSVPGTVRAFLDVINGTGTGIPVPAGLFYYFLVYRPHVG